MIQRTPNIERPDPPKIILQRRVLEIPEHVRQQLLAGVRAEKAAKVAERVEGKVAVKGVEGVGRRGLQKKFPQGQRTNQQQSDHLVCQVCGERAGKHSYYGGQVSLILHLGQSIYRQSAHTYPGVPLLQGLLPPLRPVRIQREFQVHPGRGGVRGDAGHQEELPVLQV